MSACFSVRCSSLRPRTRTVPVVTYEVPTVIDELAAGRNVTVVIDASPTDPEIGWYDIGDDSSVNFGHVDDTVPPFDCTISVAPDADPRYELIVECTLELAKSW